MAREDVTNAEVSILHLLWDRGNVTVRGLAEQLYGGRSTSQHTTVQKLLERLAGKGCVKRDRHATPHTYQHSVEREDLIGRQLQRTADKLCNGSLQPLLTHLVKS